VYNFKIVHDFEHSLFCCISYAFYLVLVLSVSINSSGQSPQKDITGNITTKMTTATGSLPNCSQ